MKRTLRVIGGAGTAAAALYGGYAVLTYVRFGHASGRKGTNPILDRLMPDYDVGGRHSVRVSAPADITLAAAGNISFHDSPIVRAIFALRALPGRFRGIPAARTERRPLFDEVLALGWRQLIEVPGRQVVMGAVTQPWRQEVRFHGLPADEFAAFREPGYAKIAWTIEVEPLGPWSSVFSTETRVATTDPVSRERFRLYWSFLSPGIFAIRYEMLRLVRAKAEQRYASASWSIPSPSTGSDPGWRP
jgi:hypothetical protein